MARKGKVTDKEIKTPGGSTLTGIAEVAHERNAPESGGQSGDTQGLSNRAESASESVKELVEEGQYFEAAVVSGIENAPDADEVSGAPSIVPIMRAHRMDAAA
jgi:hypothetical protein